MFWTPCAAHCIDLILEEIGKIPTISKALAKGMNLTSYIYTHTRLLNIMRQHTKKIDLLRAGKTKFATCYLNLKRIKELKSELQKMFVSKEWQLSKWAGETKGKQVADIVLSTHFWNNVNYILLVMGIRHVDGENKPSMGYVYEAMDRAKEATEEGFKKNESKYSRIFTIIDSRWNKQLHRPLHAAAHFFNPTYFYDNPQMEFVKEIKSGFLICLTRLVPNLEDQDQITNELPDYKKAKGHFGLDIAIRSRKKKSPGKLCLQTFYVQIINHNTY